MPQNNKNNLSLKDLIDIKEWQRIQDNFSIITDVCLHTFNPQGRQITSPSREPRLCNELLKDSSSKSKLCTWCLPTFLGGKGIADKNLNVICQAGLYNFIAPLKVEEKLFGYIILGPVVLVMRKPKEQYQKIAEELNLDLDTLWNAILEIKVTSFQNMQSMVELIKDIVEAILKSAYKNTMTKKSEAAGPALLNLVRLLNSLLDVAFQISGADVGSIMLLDKTKDELFIKASKGLSANIVKNTRIKIGEGISGLAAKENTPLLIGAKTTDNRIKNYLNRPYIRSSMVIPIKVENRLFGVINLGALQNSSVRFDKNNLQLMNNLIELVTTAITPAK